MSSPEVVEVARTKVLFLNAHLFKGTIFGGVYRKLLHRDGERADEISLRVRTSGAKIAMLAEVWGSGIRRRIIDDVRETHPYSWVPPAGPNRFKLNSGLLFLSSAPIEEPRCINFAKLTGWDSFSQKCVASVVVEGVAYVLTHVEAENDAKGVAARASNLDQVRSFIEQTLSQHPRVILAGDMNTVECDPSGARTEEYNAMFQRFQSIQLIDPHRAISPDTVADRAYTTDHKRNPLCLYWAVPRDPESQTKLDYFFTRGVTPVESGVIHDFEVQAKPASKSPQQAATVAAAAAAAAAPSTTSPAAPSPTTEIVQAFTTTSAVASPSSAPTTSKQHQQPRMNLPLPVSDHYPIFLTFI